MAKVGFTFRESYYDAVRLFSTDEERGRFLLGLCAFAFDGEEPDFAGSSELEIAFACMREHVEQEVADRLRSSQAGSRGGGRPRRC